MDAKLADCDEFLGVDIGGTKLMLSYIAMVKRDDIKLDFNKAIFNRSLTGEHFTVDQLKQSINEFLQRIRPNNRNITAVGVSICGFIDPVSGAITLCEISKLTGVKPREVMQDLFGSDTLFLIENDVRAGTIAAEYIEQKAGKQIKDMAVLVLGTGLGLGCIVNGQQMRGSVGWAGCLGSAPVRLSNGELTTFDAALGGRGIVKRLRDKTGLEIDEISRLLKEVSKRTKNDDWNFKNVHENTALTETEEAIITIIDQAAEVFGMAIATVLSIFNPAQVVLAGGVLNFDGFVRSAVSAAKAMTMEDIWNSCEIKQSQFSNQLVSLGVLLLAVNSRSNQK